MNARVKYHGQTLLAALMLTLPGYACAQLYNPSAPADAPDLSAYAKTADVAATYAPVSALSGYVQSVNTVAPTAGNVSLAIPSAYTDAQARSAVSTVGYALAAAGTSFVNSGTYQTVSALLSGTPCSTTYLGNYARVLDLWGSVRTVMVCEYDGNSYYWRPQRTDYAINNATTGGTMTLTPLLSAPVQVLTGTLSSAVTVTPSVTNAWPGATFTVVAKGVLGLFGINISGLIGGSTLPLLGGNVRTLTYTTAGWQGN